ncbi:MAG: cyclic nucleotide-binding domain-containing protein, partial [Thiotrichaceae bacterium]|nr:cyclic nucleotide-binding domain-containing protein [Thiotrichaceae bacterium]
MASKPKLDVKIAKKFHPFESLSTAKVNEIIHKSAVQKIPAGRFLFKQGDRDNWSIFLLSGTIELKQSDGTSSIIKANTAAAKNAISNFLPRATTAKAKTELSILIIDRDLLDLILNWNNSASIEVSDLDEDDDDWMTRFLHSEAFLHLPPANIQSLMMLLDEQSYSKDSIIIEENSVSNNKFYIIQKGACVVTKTNTDNGSEIPLAQLRHGDSFGEESLITGRIRSASVRMLTDGVVSSIDKKDFIKLIITPLIQRVKSTKYEKLIKDDQYELIDVRDKKEFNHHQLANTLQNIPIDQIRTQLAHLDIDKHYILYSKHENRSQAAAFLFIKQGYECSILEDGIAEIEVSLDEQIDQSNTENTPDDNIEKTSHIEETHIKPPADADAEKSKASNKQKNITTHEDVSSTKVKQSKNKNKVYSEQLLEQKNKYKESEKQLKKLHKQDLKDKTKEIQQIKDEHIKVQHEIDKLKEQLTDSKQASTTRVTQLQDEIDSLN